MTATLTDNDRETVRWFAEECLGWSRANKSLAGWSGFGLVVEYVRATTEGRWAMSLTMSSLSREFLADLRFGHGVQTACHHDPAIAAMLALRQAVGGG